MHVGIYPVICPFSSMPSRSAKAFYNHFISFTIIDSRPSISSHADSYPPTCQNHGNIHRYTASPTNRSEEKRHPENSHKTGLSQGLAGDTKVDVRGRWILCRDATQCLHCSSLPWT